VTGLKTAGKIGILGAASLVFSNMVGAGIFTTSGFVIESLRSPVLLLAMWGLGGLLAFAGAASYGELGASIPQVGGDYVYLRKAYGPLAAFLCGWMSFFAGFGAPIALTALGFVEYLTPLAPALTTQGHEPLVSIFGLSPTISAGHLAAVGVIWLLSLIHYLGIRTSGKVQFSITLLNVLLIVSFLVAALSSKAGSWSNFNPGPEVPILPAGETLPAMAVSLVMVLYAYTGFNAAAYVAGEIRNPGRNLPRSLLTGTAVVVVLYLGLNLVYIYALPVQQMSGRIDVAALAATGLIGQRAGALFSIVVAICVLACSSAMICIGPRIYYVMASDGVFFSSVGRLSQRYRTPGAGLALQALWASLLVIMGTFQQLLTYCGFMLSLFTSLTISGVFVLRRRYPEMNRPYRVWGYPLTPAFFLMVSIWMMIYVIFIRPGESLLGLIIVGAGIPAYFAWKRKSRDRAQSAGEVNHRE
jgi:APA family basic amino acid/polyamine antiporter